MLALLYFVPKVCAVLPIVLSPLELRLSASPWTLAAFDLPAFSDLSLSLFSALNVNSAVVASGTAIADVTGRATAALVPSARALPPGLYTLSASCSAASWLQQTNVTVVGSAPFVVRGSEARLMLGWR